MFYLFGVLFIWGLFQIGYWGGGGGDFFFKQIDREVNFNRGLLAKMAKAVKQ